MSKFNSYARRLNEAAKEAFEKYQKAEKVYNEALARRVNAPYNETRDEKTIVEARIIEARNNLDKAKEALHEGRRTMESIRGELIKDLGRAYTANPEHVDPNTMELLKSGILSPGEYVDLANRAINNGNNTMLRIIGSYAEKLANDLQGNKNATNERGLLYSVSSRAKGSTGAAELESYDTLVSVYDRCTNNPGIINRWDELTQGTIEAF